MFTRRPHFLALLSLPALLVLASPVHANIHNLRSALILRGDAPRGFSTPHYRVYAHFTREMKVTVNSTNSAGATSTYTAADCSLPASFAHDGWIQGLAEGFGNLQTLSGLSLCASAFRTGQGAHTAYATTKADNARWMKKQHLHFTSIARIGEESFAYEVTQQNKLLLAGITFRHDSALLEMTYSSLGSSTYSVNAFLALAKKTDQRLN